MGLSLFGKQRRVYGVTREDTVEASLVARIAPKENGIIHAAEMMVVRNVPVDNTTMKKNSKAVNSAILANIPTKKSSKIARTVPVDNTRIKGGNPRVMTAYKENGKMTVENIIATTAIVGNTRTNPVRPRVKNVLLG